MKTKINCPCLTSEKYSKEVLNDLVTSLEQLEIMKNTVFNRLNSALSERVNKLCNLKSRINRANQIISNYSSVNEAITLKSKFHYPTKKHYFYTPTTIDKNLNTPQAEQNIKINKKVVNDKTSLGFKSLAAKDKILTYDKYMSFATQFNDIVNELDKVTAQEISCRKALDDFEPLLNYSTSNFSFGNRERINTKKQSRISTRETNKININDLQDIMIEKKEEEELKAEQRKKNIQQAPKSIIQKVKIKKERGKKKTLKNDPNKINFVLPTQLQLGNVADFANLGDEIEEEKDQENNIEEEEEDDDDLKDDALEHQRQVSSELIIDLPIDFIRKNNEARAEGKKNIQINQLSQQNQPNNNQINLNTNAPNQNNSTNEINTQAQSPNTGKESQQPPQETMQNSTQPTLQNTTIPEPPKPPQIVQAAQPKTQIPSPPPKPTSSLQATVVSSSGPVPPPPPPPPLKFTHFDEKDLKEVEEFRKQEEEESKNRAGEEEVSMTDLIAKSMANLKKTGEVKVKETAAPRQLTLAEQIALSKSKLQKTVNVQQKEPEKKKPNGMDLLSQQIKLRFQNLRMHEDKNEDSDESDDSF